MKLLLTVTTVLGALMGVNAITCCTTTGFSCTDQGSLNTFNLCDSTNHCCDAAGDACGADRPGGGWPVCSGGAVSATPSATSTPTMTPTATATPSQSPTHTPSHSATHTRTPTGSSTPAASTSPTASGSSSPAATPSVTPTPGLRSCFSGDSSVTLEDGSRVHVKDVNVGDKVLAVAADGSLHYDTVFRIPHHSPEETAPAVRLTTASGKTLTMTPNHFLHAGACCDPRDLTLAGDVTVGTVLYTVSDGKVVEDEVVSVETVEDATGMYNLHTLSSNIVVNDIAASHFTTDSTWTRQSRHLATLWYTFRNKLPFMTENAKLAN